MSSASPSFRAFRGSPGAAFTFIYLFICLPSSVGSWFKFPPSSLPSSPPLGTPWSIAGTEPPFTAGGTKRMDGHKPWQISFPALPLPQAPWPRASLAPSFLGPCPRFRFTLKQEPSAEITPGAALPRAAPRAQAAARCLVHPLFGERIQKEELVQEMLLHLGKEAEPQILRSLQAHPSGPSHHQDQGLVNVGMDSDQSCF